MATRIKSREGSLWDAFNKVIDRMTVGQQHTIFEVFTEMERHYSGPKAITTDTIERMVSRRKIYFFTDLRIVSVHRGKHTVYEKTRKTGIINPVQKKPQGVQAKQLIHNYLADNKPVVIAGVTWLLYQERQESWVRKNNIKLGDKVKVLHKAESKQNGWGTSGLGTYWNPIMDLLIGETGTIESFYLDSTGIRIYFQNSGDCFNFPYFVLEKVEETPPEISVTVIPETVCKNTLEGIQASYTTFKHALYTMYSQVAALATEQQMTNEEVVECLMDPGTLVSNTVYVLEALCNYEILLVDKSKTRTPKEMKGLIIDLVSIM